MKIFILASIDKPSGPGWQVQGVFSSVEKARDIGKPGDQILPMELDVDYTDIFDFDNIYIPVEEGGAA